MSGLGKPKLTYRGRIDRYADDLWLIWSNKWGSWYRPDSAGYTTDIAQAGVFSRDEAASHFNERSPKKYRVTEPFPISAIRKHVEHRQRELKADYLAKMTALSKLRVMCLTLQSESVPPQ